MIKLEFNSIKEFMQFITLFSRGNEELLKREVDELDKSTNALQTALDAQSVNKEGEKK